MSIRVVCPNGHLLKIKSKYAGKAGLCPVCRAPIRVPEPEAEISDDDSIMDVLQPHESGLSGNALQISDSADDYVEQSKGPGSFYHCEEHERLKLCRRCDKEIPADAHVCPFCNTYIASIFDPFDYQTGEVVN